MPNAAIYVRLSQDRDGTKGGTERQEQDCRKLAKSDGLKVVEVYKDDDRSAYSGKARPAFDRMLSELDRFDVLIYWKTDRLVRRTTQFFKVLDACEKADVRLVSVIDQIDTTDPIGKGVAGLLASVGEQESQNIGLRVKRKQEANALAGLPSGHRRAYGYDKYGTEVVASEADMIKEARDRVLDGESMSSICRDWNARGVKPTTADEWRVHSFKRMITGTRIAGLRVHRGEVVGDASWPAIITPDDRDDIIRVLGDPKTRSRGAPASYLLTRLLLCGRCGGRLHSASHGDGERIWTCRRTPGDTDRCGNLSVRAKHVDPLVEHAILTRLDSPALGRALKRGRGTKAKTDAKQAADLEARITQLGLDHDAGLITRKEWLQRRAPLVERHEASLAELAKENDAQALHVFEGVNPSERWKTISLEQQRRVAISLVDSITIEVPAKRGNTFDPDRISISWRV